MRAAERIAQMAAESLRMMRSGTDATLADVERAARAEQPAELPTDAAARDFERAERELAEIRAPVRSHTWAVESLARDAVERAAPLLEHVRSDARARALDLYGIMVAQAIESARRWGAAEIPAEWHYLSTPDAYAAVLDVSRRTVYNLLSTLAEAGLIGYRQKVGRLIVGQTAGGRLLDKASEGTVYSVRLTGEPRSGAHRTPTAPAALLSEPWRDLVGDLRAGNLYRDRLDQLRRKLESQQVAHINRGTRKPKDAAPILAPLTTTPPRPKDTPENSLCVQVGDNSVSGALIRSEIAELLTLPSLGLRDRSHAVVRLAGRMAADLGETSVKPIASLIWNALYLDKSGRAAGVDYLAHIAQAYQTASDRVRRLRAGKAKPLKRSPGALLFALLDRAGVLQELQRVPTYREADRHAERFVTIGLHPDKLDA